MENELILFETADKEIKLTVPIKNNTVWLNRKQLAELFGRDVKTIGKHINNALKEELDNSVVANFATTASDGKVYQIEHYNLDMIISIGYRVKSNRGVEFRKWANSVLKQYIIQGYAINEKRLEALQRTINIQTKMLACTLEVDEAEVLKAVSLYTNALMLLDQYDHQSLKKPTGSKAIYRITYEDCRNMVNAMEDSFHSDVFGVEKEVVYNRESTCSTCHGSGAKPGTSPVTCSRCHGSGVINVDTQTPLGMMRRQVTCDVCHGKGKEIKEPCHTCHGTGHEKKTHKVSVKIPAGVETGQQIRLQGQGEAGFNGGPYGDLFVIINVLPSNKFERNGSTIYYTMNISFVQAALGDTVEVPTVHGDVEMTIPAGTQTGKTFRLRGKGAPKLHGGGQGDQHVTVNIVTPTKLNDAQVKALKQFAQAGGDKVGNPKKKGFFDKVKDAFDGE